MSTEVPVSLSTICAGGLEAQFQSLYPALISQLKEGNSSSVSIGISFKRVPDTATMVNVSYKITPRFPAKGKASICQITGDNKLKTDAPVESNITQLNLVVGGNE